MALKDINNIALIGMPAVGKSTMGKLLAKTLQYRFLDTDDLIETGEGSTLEEIIGATGLEAFLDIEEKHLLTLNCADHIIATGGSVVYRKKAMVHLSEISHIIYLSIDLEILKKRLKDLKARGVAISPGQDLSDLYLERTRLYKQYCNSEIACSNLSPDGVVKQILSLLSAV